MAESTHKTTATPSGLGAVWGLPSEHPEVRSISSGEARALLSGNGTPVSLPTGSVIRVPTEAKLGLAFRQALESAAQGLLREEYVAASRASRARLLRLYYRLRPWIPRWVQLAIRRLARPRTGGTTFPHWPVEPLYADLAFAWLASQVLEGRATSVAPRWPDQAKACVLLTHDVELSIGQSLIRDVANMELAFGVRSCFNIVAERYAVDHETRQWLVENGFEVGLHGIKHDGRLFESREMFERRLVDIEAYMKSWHVNGFRSPATHRVFDWMPALPALYDSSFPDVDPYEPQPGGCICPWPFAIDRLLEIPITLAQDHTLWEILGRPALPTWLEKLEWLRTVGGVATLILHPDYLTTPARWQEYREFVSHVAGDRSVWVTVPSQLFQWWTRDRPVAERQSVTIAQTRAGAQLVFSGAPQ